MTTVAYIGASRGVGFAAYADLAAARHNIRSVLMLRRPDVLKDSPSYLSLDATIKERTTLLMGDAHNSDSIKGLLDECGPDLKVIVFSIGFTPPSGFLAATKAIAKGFPIDPPDLCSRGFIILLQALQQRHDSYASKPKIVLVSSMGMGKVAHGTIPFALRLLYTTVLEHPHADKIAMEVTLSKALLPSSSYPHFFPSPSEISPMVTTAGDIDAVISPFIAPQDVCVVRPALLTDDAAKGKEKYRIIQEGTGREESSGKGMYSISRKDVGGFIARLLGGDDDVQKWWGCQPVLAY
ncbi:uncharacterized protein EI90DRAFT_458712 [Cantharellus anzutake]|uniref:uncharacterized protein n=1 Tax=Cantharellus anzutake TaxID=1750568 RepID=UPI001902D8BB|nr:uncharacterized protein EI90DRAFT_458712 [Cantharellus anzutake]KAF8334734.1 hypothetical protein EI90DRAFT_458712 [Cantharellus anzutake]